MIQTSRERLNFEDGRKIILIILGKGREQKRRKRSKQGKNSRRKTTVHKQDPAEKLGKGGYSYNSPEEEGKERLELKKNKGK